MCPASPGDDLPRPIEILLAALKRPVRRRCGVHIATSAQGRPRPTGDVTDLGLATPHRDSAL
jgi:hypothetical protein